MEDKEIKAALRQVLSEVAMLDVPLDTLGDQADLYAAGLASVTSVHVMIAVEERFDIEIPDQMLNYRLFQSIESLASAIAECLRAKTAV